MSSSSYSTTFPTMGSGSDSMHRSASLGNNSALRPSVGLAASSSSGNPSPLNSKAIRRVTLSGLPPPPPPAVTGNSRTHVHGGGGGSHLHHRHHHHGSAASSQYQQSMVRSMTIEEMRQLHQRALQDAEAKRTELRLVLASRYRELVGSSEEVLRMKERAQELHELVYALPSLMEKVVSQQLAAITDTNTPATVREQEGKTSEGEDTEHSTSLQSQQTQILQLRRDLSYLPRVAHRALDVNNVHQGTTILMELFSLIAIHTDQYPLASVLAKSSSGKNRSSMMTDPDKLAIAAQDAALQAQMRMIFLQVQTMPRKIHRMASRNLLMAASFGPILKRMNNNKSCAFGAQVSAESLASIDLLTVTRHDDSEVDRASRLLDTYFESKAKLLVSLLNKLSLPESMPASASVSLAKAAAADAGAGNAEKILSKIILILQNDTIMHPYMIFVKRDFPMEEEIPASITVDTALASKIRCSSNSIMNTMPIFDPDAVKQRCSKFLVTHLPLIRTKVKSILVRIAGTTASALGQMRQSLYDKTDGAESMEGLNDNPICSWDEAVAGLVDVRTVLSVSDAPTAMANTASSSDGLPEHGSPQTPARAPMQQRFSLWSALFSNTFSSLVHSLLTTAFSSVHRSVVSNLRNSLAKAPPLAAMLPHEAYANTVKIATQLNQALLKVSDDSHELLVHAEERMESERRLRQSLYVQTCEIMGRLVCELRRMVTQPSAPSTSNSSREDDATQEWIVGRLCFLLKFRLTALPTLLDPAHAPASLAASGMISVEDLQSAFALADHDDDGLITLDEALEAVESAFSGTPFHGSQMLRETLLLSNSVTESADSSPRDVTLSELMLLTARGLRNTTSHHADGVFRGPSALGTVQRSLDDIVATCFSAWSNACLAPCHEILAMSFRDELQTARTASANEWSRMMCSSMSSSLSMTTMPLLSDGAVLRHVSPHMVAYFVEMSSILNRSTCPSDSLPPVPSRDYALSMGIVNDSNANDDNTEVGTRTIANTSLDTIRWALLTRAFLSVTTMMKDQWIEVATEMEQASTPALMQLYLDLSFIQFCFTERNVIGFGPPKLLSSLSSLSAVDQSKQTLQNLIQQVERLYTSRSLDGGSSAMQQMVAQCKEKHQQIAEVSDMFFASLLGETSALSSPNDLFSGNTSSSNLTGTTTVDPLVLPALTSSRRFALLPVQADRSLNDIRLRGRYASNKERDESDAIARQHQQQQEASGGVMSTGFGFFSSMLKKK